MKALIIPFRRYAISDKPYAPTDREANTEPIFLRLAPADIALVKFLFESYEGVAIVRTVDRRAAVIVALVSRDFLSVARAILDDLRSRIAIAAIPRPPEAGEDWLLRLLDDVP